MLERFAAERSYRKVFLNYPDSWRTLFGAFLFRVGPASLMGIDLNELLLQGLERWQTNAELRSHFPKIRELHSGWRSVSLPQETGTS